MPYSNPFAKCRPVYKVKDLLASCSANVGQYQGIKQEGGDQHHTTTAVAVKSTVVTPPPAVPPPPNQPLSPRADRTSFPTRVQSTTELPDDTGPGHEPDLFDLTHIEQCQLDAMVGK